MNYVAHRSHFLKQQARKIFLFILQSLLIIFAWLPVIVISQRFILTLSSADHLAAQLKRNIGYFVDFSRLYACAQVAKTAPDKIWDHGYEVKALENSLHISATDHSLANQIQCPAIYTPQCLALIMPLTILPLNQAIILFELTALLVSIIPITLLLKKYQHFSRSQIVVWWLIVLAMPSLLQNLCLGQFEVILAGLSAIFLLTWENTNSLIAPLMLALTIAIKPHCSLIMLIMVLATRRYRILCLTLLFSILILAYSTLIIGSDAVFKYPSVLFTVQKGFVEGSLAYSLANAINLSGVISIFTNRHFGYVCGLFSTVIFILATTYIWRIAVRSNRDSYPFAYTVSLLLNLILGPYENFYALFLLTVAWAMTIPAVGIGYYTKMQTPSLHLWFLAFLLFPIISWQIVFHTRSFLGLLHLFILLLLLILALYNFWIKTRFDELNTIK